MGNAS
jgi:hypothetical protein